MYKSIAQRLYELAPVLPMRTLEAVLDALAPNDNAQVHEGDEWNDNTGETTWYLPDGSQATRPLDGYRMYFTWLGERRAAVTRRIDLTDPAYH